MRNQLRHPEYGQRPQLFPMPLPLQVNVNNPIAMAWHQQTNNPRAPVKAMPKGFILDDMADDILKKKTIDNAPSAENPRIFQETIEKKNKQGWNELIDGDNQVPGVPGLLMVESIDEQDFVNILAKQQDHNRSKVAPSLGQSKASSGLQRPRPASTRSNKSNTSKESPYFGRQAGKGVALSTKASKPEPRPFADDLFVKLNNNDRILLAQPGGKKTQEQEDEERVHKYVLKALAHEANKVGNAVNSLAKEFKDFEKTAQQLEKREKELDAKLRAKAIEKTANEIIYRIDAVVQNNGDLDEIQGKPKAEEIERDKRLQEYYDDNQKLFEMAEGILKQHNWNPNMPQQPEQQGLPKNKQKVSQSTGFSKKRSSSLRK